MILQNNTRTTFIHNGYKLEPGAILDIPDKIAKIWQKVAGVVEYVDPQKAKKAQEEAKAKQAALEEENAKLKAELEALKKTKSEEAKAKTAKK